MIQQFAYILTPYHHIKLLQL